MISGQNGAFRLFEFKGITVYLHWSWFLLAFWQTSNSAHKYESPVWAGLQYLTLFAIVLLHEFGHSLACRQVGGRAEQIVLWPLGGIAYVAPPQRPGPVLWSIAAGPLVNVALVPVLLAATWGAESLGLKQSAPDLFAYLRAVQMINFVLLGFNLLPIYPLDGGQILQAILWFFIGQARSLYICSLLGLVSALAVLVFALYTGSLWTGIMAAFILMASWSGFQRARVLTKGRTPRHEQFNCPNCGSPPSKGALWRCPQCASAVDTFAHDMACPHCGESFLSVACPECRQLSSSKDWRA